jgi:hypothetical protein
MLCGLSLILAACLGCAQIDASWNRDQFRFWQYLQMVGQPMFAVSLLMFATNTVKRPEEGPYASALVNFARALGDAGGTWFLELVTRWRGALHSDGLVDQVGQNWFRTIQAYILLPKDPAPLLPNIDSLDRQQEIWDRAMPKEMADHMLAAFAHNAGLGPHPGKYTGPQPDFEKALLELEEEDPYDPQQAESEGPFW